MMNKDKNQFRRIFKELSSHLLFVHQEEDTMIFKAFNKRDIKINFLQASCKYEQLPIIFKVNFANIQEVLEDMELTPVGRIFIDPSSTLVFQLQVGSKLRDCKFKLASSAFTYKEEIEYMLWIVQNENKEISENKASMSELNKLKLTVERQGREICSLSEDLLKQKQKNQQLASRYQEVLRKQRQRNIELASRWDSAAGKQGEVQKLKDYFEGQLSKLSKELQELRGQKKVKQQQNGVVSHESKEKETNKQAIEINSHDQNQQKPRERAQSISSEEYDFYDNFQMDENGVNQAEPSCFYRLGQRFKLTHANQTPKQLNSVLHLANPRGKVTFRLISTKKHNIWVGLITIDRIHLPFTKRQKGAISYKLKGGKQLFENGVRAGISTPLIKPLQQLSVQVDRLARKMRWIHSDCYSKQKQICERGLPLQFTGKELFPFVTMIDDGDQIQFA